MSRSKKLSKADLFYIEQNKTKTVEELASDIGCSVRQVKTTLDKLKKVEPEPQPQHAEQIPANKTATGVVAIAAKPIVRDDGITVMTAQASQWADEMRRETPEEYLERNRDKIFRR